VRYLQTIKQKTIPHSKARYHAPVAFPGNAVIMLRDLAWDLVAQRMFKFEPVERQTR